MMFLKINFYLFIVLLKLFFYKNRYCKCKIKRVKTIFVKYFIKIIKYKKMINSSKLEYCCKFYSIIMIWMGKNLTLPLLY